MFTGIIETLGILQDIDVQGSNKSFWLKAAISTDLKIDQSVAHNGVCLTVDAIKDDRYRVTAIAETLDITNLNSWKIGDYINLERCLTLNSRIDGHLVQGHVDTTATCIEILDSNGSWELSFRFNDQFADLLINKGSICVNGISLTAFNLTINTFTVALIPYTWQHTNLKDLQIGSLVNLEFDLMGKYILRHKEVQTIRNTI